MESVEDKAKLDAATSAAVDGAVDAAAADGGDCNGDDAAEEPKKEPKTAAETVRAMNSLDVGGGGGGGVLKTSIETWRMSDGKVRKNDLYANDQDEALDMLRNMVRAAAEKSGGVESERGVRWKFRAVPQEQFGRTLDDVFRAFLRWATVEDGDDTEHNGEEEEKRGNGGGSKRKGRINVSKAYRRLDSYATWMEDAAGDLLSPDPVTAENVRGAWDKWKMRLSYDARGRLVWWFDFGAINLKECRKIAPEESLRLFVWLSHVIMFDEKAQRNGMVFAEDCARIGFWDCMTLFPMKLGLKIDRLTIGVLPVKMKKLFILETPVWCDVLMKLMGAFLSKKMKRRMIVVKNKDHGILADELGGTDCIPVGFGRCGGKMKGCIVSETYFENDDVNGANDDD